MTETAEITDPMEVLCAVVARYQRAIDGPPHADASADAEYAYDLVALACRAVVRDVAKFPPGSRPVGWDDDPVHGTADDPAWPQHRAFTCGDCGEEFGSNCAPGDITCTECEARLCSNCGHWGEQQPPL